MTALPQWSEKSAVSNSPPVVGVVEMVVGVGVVDIAGDVVRSSVVDG